MVVDLFPLIDRRCRRARPRVRDLRDRAILLDRMGFPRAAERDVEALLGLTHQDTYVLQWIMECHADAQTRRSAARTIAGSDRATTREQDAAIVHLIGAGETIVIEATRLGGTVRGWVAWSGGASPVLSCLREDGVASVLALPIDPSRRAADHVRRVRFQFAAADDMALRLSARCGTVESGPIALPPARHRPGSAASDARAALSVVLPVFGDPPSLELCLDALRPQLSAGVRLFVIDDASPDPLVSAQAEAFCRSVGGTYQRLAMNAGFAAAVNAGLSRCPTGDVLVLNSDVILPPDALDRLRAAARRSSGIATVSPLSSDAGSVTFPDPRAKGAAPGASHRLAIDRAARQANPATIVDIHTAHASCLYITQACRGRVRAFAPHYGRGYYEDIDFMLRARAHGLRNVAACDVFVTHLGSRSFGPAKHALIARNHDVLCRRFPDFEPENLAFKMADPLRPARAAVELAVPVTMAGAVLVIAPAHAAEALIRRRESDWERQGRPCCIGRLRGTGAGARLDLRVTAGAGPRSLAFTLDRSGLRDLLDHLARWPKLDIELLHPEITLAPLGETLAQAGHAVRLVVDSHASARVARDAPAFGLHVLDRVAARAVAAAWPLGDPEGGAGSPALAAPRPGIRGWQPVLGVLYPVPGAGVERFILDFARSIRRSQATQVLVLGFAIDERQLMSPGNVQVSGLQADEDPAEVLGHYGVRAVLSPYRASLVWYLDEVAARLRVPSAFFDWSPDGAPAGHDRLALDHRATDVEACAALGAWTARVARPDAVVTP